MMARGAQAILAIESYFSNFRIQEDANLRGVAPLQKHRHDVRSGAVAEKLPFGSAGIGMFFVIGNSMFFDKLDEIVWSKTSQRRTAKVGIVGQEIPRAAVKICEVTPAAARDQNFLSGFVGAFKNRDARAESARFRCAQESGRASTQYDGVKFHLWNPGLPCIRNLLG